MIFIFFYNPQDGKVISYSDSKNVAVSDKFASIELDVSEEDYEKLKQNYLSKIVDEKLILEPSSNNLSEEKKKTALSKLRKWDKEAGVAELKNILLELLN